jgi:hypothetical protein
MTGDSLHPLIERLQHRELPGDHELAALGRVVDNHVTMLSRRLELAHRVLAGLNELAIQLYGTEQYEALEELGLSGDQQRLIQYLEATRDGLLADTAERLAQRLAIPAHSAAVAGG